MALVPYRLFVKLFLRRITRKTNQKDEKMCTVKNTKNGALVFLPFIIFPFASIFCIIVSKCLLRLHHAYCSSRCTIFIYVFTFACSS